MDNVNQRRISKTENSRASKVSIVVPISNMAGRLENLSKWLIESEDQDVEVLLICNNSTDDTLNELKHLIRASNLTRVKLFNFDKKGPGAARNFGLENSTGEWVVFWDADDLGKIMVLKSILGNLSIDVDLVICDYDLVLHSGKIVNKNLTGSQANKIFAVAMNPGVWRMLFRRSFVSECRFGNSVMGEDQVFLTEALKLSPKIFFSEENIYSYFVGVPGQLTSVKRNIEELALSTKHILEILKRKSGGNGEIIFTVFIRQTFTLIVRGKLRTKFHALALISKILKSGYADPASTAYSRFLLMTKVFREIANER